MTNARSDAPNAAGLAEGLITALRRFLACVAYSSVSRSVPAVATLQSAGARWRLRGSSPGSQRQSAHRLRDAARSTGSQPKRIHPTIAQRARCQGALPAPCHDSASPAFACSASASLRRNSKHSRANHFRADPVPERVTIAASPASIASSSTMGKFSLRLWTVNRRATRSRTGLRALRIVVHVAVELRRARNALVNSAWLLHVSRYGPVAD